MGKLEGFKVVRMGIEKGFVNMLIFEVEFEE